MVVGHWAERIVGKYLLRKGYLPYHSHDSQGAFDIYVRIRGVDVGIQVKYSTHGRIYLSESEARRIMQSAKENNWIPIVALVEKNIRFFSQIKAGQYSLMAGYSEIEDAIAAIRCSTRGELED